MKLIYIMNARIPTEKAHGFQIAKMCEAFAESGADLTLVLPKRKNDIKKDLFDFYSLKRNFKLEYLPLPDFIRVPRFGFWINQFLFSFAIFFKFLYKKKKQIIFTRDELTGFLLRKVGFKVFYDMHGFPENKRWFWKISMRSMLGIAATNEWKIEQCNKIFGIDKSKMIVARNGFDRKSFSVKETKSELRMGLYLPQDKKIVMYTGHLYDWKGVSTLVKAAAILEDIQFVLVGGSQKEKQDFLNDYEVPENVIMLGQKPHGMIPKYLAAADVLVLPNSARSKEERFSVYSKYDTSPIKLFEYMASNQPIVASALPSIKEVLSDSNAVLVDPDNEEQLVQGIEKALNDRAFADKIAERAFGDVQVFTWSNRAKLILDFIKKTIDKP